MNAQRPLMRFVRRVAYWLRFGRHQDELREELAFHREQVAADAERRGLAAEAVAKTMGHETSMREEAREVWLAASLDAVFKDCRHAWRGLRRTPVFTAVAVFTLAVGIGANTAIFSVVHHLLLAPLPFPDGNRIVRLGTRSAADPDEPFDLPTAVLSRLEQQSRALEGFAAAAFVRATLDDTANHDVLPGARITPSLLHTLRVAPVGRAFTRDDARAGAPPVAMISYGVWQSRFGGARDALGAVVRVNGVRRTIVGITPRDLTLPMRVEEAPQVWLPFDLGAEDAAIGYARLRAGATTDAALRELRTTMAERPDPHWSKSTDGSVERAVDRVDPRFKHGIVIMFAAVSGLLLIACANIANLLFMRGWTRQRELAIRRALGGGRFRVARLLLIESSLLAILGGALGLGIAWKGLSIILAIMPGGNSMVGGPEVTGAGISRGVLAWTTVTTLVTSLLFGVGPAFLSTGGAAAEALRTGGGIRSVVGSAGARRLRSGIIIGQVALSFAFLVAAALLVKSFVVLARFDVGFNARGLAIATIKLANEPAARDRASVEQAIAKAVKSAPGVTGAAFGGPMLMTDIRGGPFVVDGPHGTETLDLDMCEMPFVSPDYFREAGIPLMRGRSFEGDDDVVINQKLAQRFWPNGNALGVRMRVGNGPKGKWMTIVGIAGDVTIPGVKQLFTMQMYRPTSAATQFVNLVSFRAGRSPEMLDGEIKRSLENAGAAATLVSIRGVESVLDTRVLARPRFALSLFGVFASIALLLTAVGLYAVVAYSVTQRTREIGVRVALGADSTAVARMVLGDGIRHVVIGVLLGLGIAFATTRLLTSFLYDGDASDPRAFAGATLVLAIVTLVASSIPLRRALGIAPMDALRTD